MSVFTIFVQVLLCWLAGLSGLTSRLAGVSDIYMDHRLGGLSLSQKVLLKARLHALSISLIKRGYEGFHLVT